MKREGAVKWLSGVAKEVGKKIISWFLTSKVLARPRDYMVRIIWYAYQTKRTELSEDLAEAVGLIASIRDESGMILSYPQAFLIYSVVKNTEKIEGDLGEVGVYTGGSAKLICEAKGGRTLHLFDTFQGIPSVGEEDVTFHVGQYAASLDSVTDYLNGYRHVHFFERKIGWSRFIHHLSPGRS